MTVYFCLDHVLDAMLTGDIPGPEFDPFIPVFAKIPNCNDHREDALILSSTPKLLDLNDNKGVYQLASLVEDVPLYQINLELLVDDVLTQRHRNNMVAQAIEKAFEDQPIPNTMGQDGQHDMLEGSLRHPMIGHIDRVTLCKIYLNFMRALPKGHADFAFEKRVLGRHTDPFRDRFDGYLSGDQGKVKANILLGFGLREDYDPRKPIENYVENGRRSAEKMRITEPNELMWLWLESDHYQLRRCHDIDRLLSLRGLKRTPNWVRTDVFNCLEKEAMKQVLAMKMVAADPALSILSRKPAIRKAIEASAQGQIDESLQQLLTQTLNNAGNYSGAAEKFRLRALDRLRESKSS